MALVIESDEGRAAAWHDGVIYVSIDHCDEYTANGIRDIGAVPLLIHAYEFHPIAVIRAAYPSLFKLSKELEARIYPVINQCMMSGDWVHTKKIENLFP